jgi:hypothetical protein
VAFAAARVTRQWRYRRRLFIVGAAQVVEHLPATLTWRYWLASTSFLSGVVRRVMLNWRLRPDHYTAGLIRDHGGLRHRCLLRPQVSPRDDLRRHRHSGCWGPGCTSSSHQQPGYILSFLPR